MSALNELTTTKFTVNSGRKVLKKSEYQQYLDATLMIKQAQQRADEIIAEARQLREQERQRGYQEGLRKAEAARAEAILHTLGLCEAFIDQNQRDIAGLVMLVARKVLGSLDEEQKLAAIVHAVISKQRNHPWVILHVAPAQAGLARNVLNRLEEKVNVNATLQEDSGLSDGSCILETPLGKLDATLDSQLMALENVLRHATHASST